jgi:hypothetical protein
MLKVRKPLHNGRSNYILLLIMASHTTTRLVQHSSLGLGLAGAAIAVVIWLERAYVPGVGWLWLALSVTFGGIGVALLRRRAGRGAACTPGPRLSPLQVSFLALQVVGVVLYHNAQNAQFRAAFPALSAGWLPLLCIVGGVLGLGILSINGACRDVDLEGRV